VCDFGEEMKRKSARGKGIKKGGKKSVGKRKGKKKENIPTYGTCKTNRVGGGGKRKGGLTEQKGGPGPWGEGGERTRRH